MALVKAGGNAGLLLDFLGHRGGRRWSMSSMEVRSSNRTFDAIFTKARLLREGCGAGRFWAWRGASMLPEVSTFQTSLWSGPSFHHVLSINERGNYLFGVSCGYSERSSISYAFCVSIYQVSPEHSPRLDSKPYVYSSCNQVFKKKKKKGLYSCFTFSHVKACLILCEAP